MVLVAKREAGHAADQAAQEHARHRGGREGGGGPRLLLLSRFDAGVGVEGETGVRPRGERICIGPALRLPRRQRLPTGVPCRLLGGRFRGHERRRGAA